MVVFDMFGTIWGRFCANGSFGAMVVLDMFGPVGGRFCVNGRFGAMVVLDTMELGGKVVLVIVVSGILYPRL